MVRCFLVGLSVHLESGLESSSILSSVTVTMALFGTGSSFAIGVNLIALNTMIEAFYLCKLFCLPYELCKTVLCLLVSSVRPCCSKNVTVVVELSSVSNFI